MIKLIMAMMEIIEPRYMFEGFWGHGKMHTTLNIYKAAAAKSFQLYLTLCNPIDGSPPGSPISGILLARTLEWVAISFSNAGKWKVKNDVCAQLLATPWTAAYQAPPSMGFSRQEYWSGVPLPSLKSAARGAKLQQDLLEYNLCLPLPSHYSKKIVSP